MSDQGLFARVARLVEQRPEGAALLPGRRDGSTRSISVAQLAEGCRTTAEALSEAGVRRGHLAVTMTRDPYEMVAVVYGLLSVGAVPVLVDPGLPRDELRFCLRELAPQVFVGEPLAHLARRVLGWARGHAHTALVTGRRALPGLGRFGGLGRLGRPLPVLVPEGGGPAFDVPEPPAGELAMIAFTSGSTGTPKGVEYRYGTLAGQLDALGAVLAVPPGGVLLSGFLPFALFGPALGVPTVAPAVNHRAPARTPAHRLLRPLLEHRPAVVAASPAVLGLLADHCARRSLGWPSVRRVVSFGAPLRAGLVEALRAVLPPEAEVVSAYGATECLPISAVGARELAAAPPGGVGAGTCLGRAVPGVEIQVLEADEGGVGEIAVSGPNVSPAYHARPGATAAAKIVTERGLLHRTGDMGRLDAEGRLWFHGRRAHRVVGAGFVLTTEGVEAACDAVPGVRRTALVGVGPAGAQRPVLCVELARGRGDRAGRAMALRRLRGVLDALPEGRRIASVLVHPGRFPTDIRHNSKINRVLLAAWAAGRTARGAR
ncbi:AMP-binding protein [Streptomyces millisiae]|uniref:AMP-binding protein n=1 Tax=Streptomyces millisiae TaxID=3075542 RepID=A0ABU2LMI1_9ACTN|nr:AMP-binding protein [Streptomyces sp. DSM 44918]MDT0318710.1 AMP-binding protein [Streptomyces sp. DSM 44918]